MGKARTFKAIINFKGKERYDKSYVRGRIVQMAKFICADDDGKEVPVSIAKWKVKEGRLVEEMIRVRTSEKKFFKFLEKVDDTYPGLVSEFAVMKPRKK